VFSYARSTDKLTTPMLHEFCSNLDDYFGGVTPAQAWMDFRSLSLVGTKERFVARSGAAARGFGRQHCIEPHATRIIAVRREINGRAGVCGMNFSHGQPCPQATKAIW